MAPLGSLWLATLLEGGGRREYIDNHIMINEER